MRLILLGVAALSLVLVANYGQADPPSQNGDWPQWRGPRRDALCTETGLLKEWPKSGPKLLWDSNTVNGGHSVGIGFASLAMVQGRIYTMGDHFGNEKDAVKKGDKTGKKAASKGGDGSLYCLDAATGKEIWSTRIGPSYFNANGSGSRCTPTLDGERLYALSPHGLLVCAKIQDGSILWEKNLVKDFGGKMMSGWGYSESPLVDGANVVCTPGGKAAAVVALNKLTGDVVWKCELPTSCGSGYSSLVAADVGGIRQYITVMGKELGLIGVDARSGKFLWHYAKAANGMANIPTALVKDDYVFTATGYGAGAALLKLVPDGKAGTTVHEEYFLKGGQLQNHHGGMVMVGDYIYGGHGNNDGQPFCLAWKTGKFAWGPKRGPGSGSAAVLYADGNLYFRYQGGSMALIEATPSSCNVKCSFQTPAIAKTAWAHPVIYKGKLYLRGDDHILCYNIKKGD